MESEGTRRNPTLICAPIMADSGKQMVVQMNKAKVSGADLVEVRLDFLKRFSPTEDIKSLVKQCPLPTLFTYSLKDVQKRTENVDTDEDPSGWRPYYRFVDGLNEKYVKNEVISDEKASTSEHSALYGCCSFMVFMLGREAAIPTMTLIVGGNLLKGLKGSGVPVSIIIGIVAIRYIFLPLSGILIVKGAIHFGLVQSDPLYQFVLLVQFALPPAMNIGTITQLFGAGQSECSVILLWTYLVASVSLTLWLTLFMRLVAA